MTVPGRLAVGVATGHITGPARLVYNTPFPTVNGTPGGGSSSMMGVVMHTEVGHEAGTIALFNNPASNASAFFSIGFDGTIHQYGPIGRNWEAWAQMAGNRDWYSIEHEDGGNTQTPLTPAQIDASAQLVEVLSRFAGFPLQVTDSTSVKGYGTHVMGGAAWGGHTCPGPGPRAGQRAAIIALAKEIRVAVAPLPPPPVTPPPPVPPPVPPPPVTLLEGYVVYPGAAGGLAGRAVTSADAGHTWQ